MRRLSGWSPAEVTTYEYDGDRLVRSVTVRESEFTPDEVALRLALGRVKAVPRNRLGVPLSEAMDPANQFKFQPLDKPEMDWSEKVVEDKKDAYYKARPDANRNGHRWGLKPSG